jgi:predicted mannosyl-3-phosphoglycerate phosphatase (HAD superfamily)
LRQTSTVVFCGVDALLPVRGRVSSGFDEFCLGLEHAGVPMVWVTARSRAQLDEPIRKLGHRHPFIGEDGCGVYLPEGYFHLRVENSVRMGRFTCIPIAQAQPAAAQALQELSEDSGVAVVTLKALSPRELAQNLELPAREAEAARQRDFDEPFFLAGASDDDVARFQEIARVRKLVLRRHGVLWSVSAGSSLRRAVQQVSKLYERALRFRPTAVAMATASESAELFPACDRQVLLSKDRTADLAAETAREPFKARTSEHPLSDPDVWDSVLAEIVGR